MARAAPRNTLLDAGSVSGVALMQPGTTQADDHGLSEPFLSHSAMALLGRQAQSPSQQAPPQQAQQQPDRYRSDSHQPQPLFLMDEDWVQPPLPQRSQSLSHAEMQQLQARHLPFAMHHHIISCVLAAYILAPMLSWRAPKRQWPLAPSCTFLRSNRATACACS